MQVDLLAANKDLYINQGSFYTKRFTLMDGLNPINLTGTVLSFNIKRYSGVKPIIFSYVITVTDALSGIFNLDIEDIETKLLVDRRYVYEITAIESSKIIKIMYGQVIVENF